MKKERLVFLLFWLVALVLYIPAGKAGWVIDATGWLYEITHETFPHYINRVHSETQSQYQVTQFVTWALYKIWGPNPWAWSVFYITLHAANAWLLYLICKRIFTDSAIKYSFEVALSGALLFIVSPYVSEVVIWKACYHYLQAFLFILLGLYWLQKYHYQPNKKYAVFAVCLFFVSTFSLEAFYITPFLLLCLALYYRQELRYDKKIFRNAVLYFVVPQLFLLGLYFIMFYARYGNLRPHSHSVKADEFISYLAKPIKYLFHLLFLGRFFQIQVKDKVYAFCEAGATIIVFYGSALGAGMYMVRKHYKKGLERNPLLILSAWSFLIFALLMPLAFPASALLVFFDRYCYLPAGFVYMFVAIVLFRNCGKKIAVLVIVFFGATNIYFAEKVNGYWKQSAYVDNRLLHELPALGTKRVLLLNLPENMMGVPMIGADPGGAFKAMHNLLVDSSLKNTVYDVMSYNQTTMHDGAHVTVLNDSMIDITLNQWGTWWWYSGHGGVSYENDEYRVNMKDAGHWYELTLKHPGDGLLLLYEVDAQWRVVDMSRKGIEQY